MVPAQRRHRLIHAGCLHSLPFSAPALLFARVRSGTEMDGRIFFCHIASGSASELEYQLLLARDLKLIQSNDYENLALQTTEIKRMLTVFVRKLTAES